MFIFTAQYALRKLLCMCSILHCIRSRFSCICLQCITIFPIFIVTFYHNCWRKWTEKCASCSSSSRNIHGLHPTAADHQPTEMSTYFNGLHLESESMSLLIRAMTLCVTQLCSTHIPWHVSYHCTCTQYNSYIDAFTPTCICNHDHIKSCVNEVSVTLTTTCYRSKPKTCVMGWDLVLCKAFATGLHVRRES